MRKDEGTQDAEQVVVVVDIDGTICSNTDGDYYSAVPNLAAIQNVNLLHSKGARIILFTARGSTTGIDWRGITEKQMEKWGVLYNELHFGKPFGHYYVDDKAVMSEDLEDGTFLSMIKGLS